MRVLAQQQKGNPSYSVCCTHRSPHLLHAHDAITTCAHLLFVRESGVRLLHVGTSPPLLPPACLTCCPFEGQQTPFHSQHLTHFALTIGLRCTFPTKKRDCSALAQFVFCDDKDRWPNPAWHPLACLQAWQAWAELTSCSAHIAKNQRLISLAPPSLRFSLPPNRSSCFLQTHEMQHAFNTPWTQSQQPTLLLPHADACAHAHTCTHMNTREHAESTHTTYTHARIRASTRCAVCAVRHHGPRRAPCEPRL